MKYKIINKKKLIATMIADAIGGAVFLPKRLFAGNAEIDHESVREILVIRTAYIGDVIMALPILKPLKERYPQARITFLTSKSAKPALQTNPYVDEIITYDPFWFYATPKREYFDYLRAIRKKRYDMVIETRGDIREILALVWPVRARYKVSYGVGGGAYMLTHTVPYARISHKVEYHLDMARYLGCVVNDVEWGFYPTAVERENAAALLRENGITGAFAVIHPGSRLPLKMWPGEKYAALCDKIIDSYKIPVVLLGSAGEKPIVDELTREMKNRAISFAGRTSLREMACIIEKGAVFICNDSAPMHVAAAMKTPTVSIFGPSKSVETAPYATRFRVVEKDYPCRYTCDESRCANKNFNGCMADISVDDVFSAVVSIMEES